MNKIISLVFLIFSSSISVYGQGFSLDLTKSPKHYFELPKSPNSFRLEVGANYQYFDNPLFKFSSTKNAKLAKFTSAAYNDFGLEYVSPIPIVGNFTLMGGLYLSGVEFNYHYPQTENFALFFHSLGEYFYQVSGGFGLNTNFQLRNRWYVDFSFVAVVSKIWIPASSAYVIIDTLGNTSSRTAAMSSLMNSMEILYPTQIPHPMSVRLKNKVFLNYYFSKTIAMNLSFVYNIGIPNKLLVFQYDYYKPYNRSFPDSHEKVVVSNSSFAWSLGLTVNLWNKE